MTVLEADLCVAGGGMAGVCAALAAARNGLRVVLLQDRSVLGGNASSEVRMHVCGASCSGKRPGARESGIIDEIRVEDAVRNPQRSPAMFDLLLYDKVVSEPGITLLLDTACTGCRMENGRIAAVRAVRTSTQEELLIRAPWFADCTGDGTLGAAARADFRMGREARLEYGETFAPEHADGMLLGSSILFQARRHDRPMPFTAPAWARRFNDYDLRLRPHPELDFGYWWVEWGGHLDTIAKNPAIRHELLRIALGVWDHVKNHCPRRPAVPSSAFDRTAAGQPEPEWPDPANWALEWVGFLPGKRESRRFLGLYVLTQRDIEQGRLFEDTVAYGGWFIDVHPSMGVDAPGEFPCIHHPVPHIYGIPLRALMSRNVPNLFFAGRNISASHVAFASTRVMATCAVIGQAVGTAAAVAVESGAPAVARVQRLLARDGAFLPGVDGRDPEDLAQTASVTCSSEMPDGAAALVLNGITRATRPELHPKLERSTNRWTSRELPAWIELNWSQPVTIAEVRLVFDTGFERELTLSMSEAFSATMVRGPQPETARDYRLEAGTEVLAEVRGNYQGLRIHRFPAVRTTRLRLRVEATNGLPQARVYEIRAYRSSSLRSAGMRTSSTSGAVREAGPAS